MDLKSVNQIVNDRYAVYEGDSCELMQGIPDNTMGFSIHSPPI